jgi:2-oxoglutarate ferredoxin oxidoreductase subunit alpha
LTQRKKKNKDVLTGTHYAMGNVAIAEGAIAAGCRFFAGYPITPSSEIAEHMSLRLPQVGGKFIQMEDEIASSVACIGASYSGTKAMTATSGPGFSLMLESIGLAVMTEAPMVVVNAMRASPSTGQPTKTGQGDVMQPKWGSHGDYEIIALAPWSVQESFDMTIDAFNLSERWRVPVVVLADETIVHLKEKLIIPPASRIRRIERKKPKVPPEHYKPFKTGKDLVPAMATFGSPYRFYASGLTHDERGYPDMTPEAQHTLIKRLNDKIRLHRDQIVQVDEFMMENAEIGVISYGISARGVKGAVREARKKGVKAGMFRLRTIWPFPEEQIKAFASRVKQIVVVELNYGQIIHEVDRFTGSTPVKLLAKPSSEPIHPTEILEVIAG